MRKTEDDLQKWKREKALKFISKIKLPLNISRTNYITNALNYNVITYDDIPKDILDDYKSRIKWNRE